LENGEGLGQVLIGSPTGIKLLLYIQEDRHWGANPYRACATNGHEEARRACALV